MSRMPAAKGNTQAFPEIKNAVEPSAPPIIPREDLSERTKISKPAISGTAPKIHKIFFMPKAFPIFAITSYFA